MADNSTVQGLIALANNGAASMEERRTAAFQAVTIMHKRNISGEPTSSPDLGQDFWKRSFEARLKTTYLHDHVQVFDVIGEVMGHPADETDGRAELRSLVFALARITGGVILGASIGADLDSIRASLPIVSKAFGEYDEREAHKPVDMGQLRLSVLGFFENEPPTRNEMATRLHCRGSDVQTALDQLVAEGLLRLKGKANYSKVKRPRKAKP